MITIGNIIISSAIEEDYFVCDLKKCKGECCVAGDIGAPLQVEELKEIDDSFEQVLPYLPPDAVEIIEKDGCYEKDFEDEWVLKTVGGKECVFAYYENNIVKCGFEKAYFEKKITFKKPISCHLYPIRVTKYDHYEVLNYDKWHICADACKLGRALSIPLYSFLKNPLIRKFGEKWYNELENIIESKKEKI